MQYQIKVSEQPKFKFAEQSDKVVMEHEDEYKSDSEDPSSLITDEDLSENPSHHSGTITLTEKNHIPQKDLSVNLIQFTSTTLSLLISEETPKIKAETPKPQKKSLLSALNKNKPLKNMLQHISKLKTSLKTAQETLKTKKISLDEEEIQLLNLQTQLESLTPEPLSLSARTCSCGVF